MQTEPKTKSNYIKSLLLQLSKQSYIIYCFQNQSNHNHIGKTINQDKPTGIIGITTSNNKTQNTESIQENTKRKKENVIESKDDASSNKKNGNDLKQNARRVYILGDSIMNHVKVMVYQAPLKTARSI